jgi:hypothetical protein
MNRREALGATAALLGTAILGANAFLTGCAPSEKPIDDLNDEAIALMDEIGETILPATASSPGAKAAAIGAFMKTIVTDCYSEDERAIFLQGLRTIQTDAQRLHDKSFMKLSAEEKTKLLIKYDQEARAGEGAGKPEHFFNMLNQLSVWGFFSSEPGATKAMRYVPIPGKYEGCIDYKKGEGAWVY